jgi:uncharacterized repeat protein (TIGR04052 family)
MRMLPKSLSLWLVPAVVLLQACGDDDTKVGSTRYEVKFSPRVGEQTVTCGQRFSGIGTSSTSIELLDFKLYVRDVTLVRANGERHALTLEQDGTWQRDALALLDFEDGTGTCDTGSPETHTAVTGTAPAHDDYTALEFKVGLPPEQNHLDGATAPAPLNAPGMWWSWKGGYKFLRLDVRSSKNAAFLFHLGASGCAGSVAEGFTCASGNQLSVALSGFNPTRNEVVLDVGSLYAGSDLDHQVDPASDSVSGCMSSSGDPECPAIFEKLGMDLEGNALSSPGTFFRVR